MIISPEQCFAQEACLRSSQQLEILLVLFSLKCHFSSADEQGHMERAHAATHAAGHEKQISTPHPQQGSFQPFPPRGSLSPSVLLWGPVLPWFFPITVPTLQGEGSTAPPGFAGPMESSCRDIGPCFHLPHSTALSSKLQWPITANIG